MMDEGMGREVTMMEGMGRDVMRRGGRGRDERGRRRGKGREKELV